MAYACVLQRELNFTMTRFKNIQAKVNMGPAT